MNSSGPFKKNEYLTKLLGILRNNQRALTYIEILDAATRYLVSSLTPSTN